MKAASHAFAMASVFVMFAAGQAAGAFGFRDKDGEYLDVLFGETRVLRFMYDHDASTPQRRFETYKPFLHVYDGAQRLTNGPDSETEYLGSEIRYPHHRGIFIGWNRLTCDGKRYDLWHMPRATQVHQRFEEQTAGPGLAKWTSVVHWNDPEGRPLIVERRTTTAYRQEAPAIVLLDFESQLKAVGGDVELNGDPEHAGVQYRAHNDVAAGPKEVKAQYLFHADGIDPRKDKDLPWVAMSYGLAGKRYCVQHMNHPDNPKGTVYSAYRDYGRFGAFAKTTIARNETLTLRYRFWIARGEMPSRQDLAARYVAYTNPPNVAVLQQTAK
jgi:hypothetical protein